jgi:hypothetical protein
MIEIAAASRCAEALGALPLILPVLSIVLDFPKKRSRWPAF